MTEIYLRWQSQVIQKALTTRRIILLSGPRQSGKTTLAKMLKTEDINYLTLDDITLKQAAEADPHSFIKNKSKTLIIDEIQRVPLLLPAIKKAVDEDNRPGQFLLTGSANIQSLPNVQESLAGRVRKVRLRPLSFGEYQRKKPDFLKNVFDGSFSNSYRHYDRDEVLEIAIKGGFPEVLRLPGSEIKSWHGDYIESLIERDLKDIARIQRIDAMKALINTLAAWSGKFIDISAIGSGLSIRRPTIESYINALETLYLIERIKPWTKTDYDRVGKQDKLYVCDSGLMASILGYRLEQIRLDPDRSGKLIETFAFNEIASIVDWHRPEYRLYHYRDREKREIDFIVERDDGAMLGIEIKAGSTLGKNSFKHLEWFQNKMINNKPFKRIILYTGEHVMSFGSNLWAVPFGALWG